MDKTLFFAREATSIGQIVTVQGAIESEHRVGKEVLANLKNGLRCNDLLPPSGGSPQGQ